MKCLTHNTNCIFFLLIPAFHWLSPGSCPNQSATLSLSAQTNSPSLFPNLTLSEEQFFTEFHTSDGTRDVASASSAIVSAISNPTKNVTYNHPTLNVSVNVDVTSNSSIKAGFHVTHVYGETYSFLLIHVCMGIVCSFIHFSLYWMSLFGSFVLIIYVYCSFVFTFRLMLVVVNSCPKMCCVLACNT